MGELYVIKSGVSKEQMEKLYFLMEKCGIKTSTDLINNALTLLNWVADEIEKGNAIVSFDEIDDDYYELEMPFFPKIKRKSKPKRRVNA